MKERDVNVLFSNKTPYKIKQMFKDNMLTYAENLIIKRRQLLYEKKVNEVIARTSYKLDYQQKVAYVESNVEQLIKFFRGHQKQTAHDDMINDIV